MNNNTVVAVNRCDEYDVNKIKSILREQFMQIGVDESFLKNKKIAIKPNLVSPIKPEEAATTHPTVVEAVYLLLLELGATDIILAESPGGPYTPITLTHIYKVTGMTALSEKTGLKLNTDTSFKKESFAEGKKLKSFDVITPIADCDIIFNLCKLKTHSLTGLSCAVKNLFGVIPGTLKFEMHAAYGKIEDFSEMLVDLNLTLASKKNIITVCDAVMSMEGNGPTHGNPVKTDLILSSASTFALDIVAESLIGMPGETLYLNMGAERLAIPRNADSSVYSSVTEEFSLKRPDSKAGGLLRNLPNYFGGSVARFFEPKPKVNIANCIGCGKCVGYCPQKTIELRTKKGKKSAKIKDKNCIRCYCCQELCPAGAVDTVKNPLLKLIH